MQQPDIPLYIPSSGTKGKGKGKGKSIPKAPKIAASKADKASWRY